MLEMFTRTYIDTSKFPHKVKMDTLKKGEWVYEVRLVKEPVWGDSVSGLPLLGNSVSKKPIEKLQLIKRQVDDTFTFRDLKNLGETIFFKKEEAKECFEKVKKELG